MPGRVNAADRGPPPDEQGRNDPRHGPCGSVAFIGWPEVYGRRQKTFKMSDARNRISHGSWNIVAVRDA